MTALEIRLQKKYGSTVKYCKALLDGTIEPEDEQYADSMISWQIMMAAIIQLGMEYIQERNSP